MICCSLGTRPLQNSSKKFLPCCLQWVSWHQLKQAGYMEVLQAGLVLHTANLGGYQPFSACLCRGQHLRFKTLYEIIRVGRWVIVQASREEILQCEADFPELHHLLTNLPPLGALSPDELVRRAAAISQQCPPKQLLRKCRKRLAK